MPEAKYRLYRRANGTYYQEDNETGAQVSLRTKDKHAAREKLRAANESVAQPLLNRDLARIYLRADDVQISERIWGDVMTAYTERNRETSRERCRRAFAGKDFDHICSLKIITTKSHDLMRVLATEKSSVNNYLRRLVNFAEDMLWLPWKIMERRAWPKTTAATQRGITAQEHARILAAENDNPERQSYYHMLWLTGGSQGDIVDERKCQR